MVTSTRCFIPARRGQHRPQTNAAENSGRLWLGGDFTSVNGLPRQASRAILGDLFCGSMTPRRNTVTLSVATVTGRSHVLEFKECSRRPRWAPRPSVIGDCSSRRY